MRDVMCERCDVRCEVRDVMNVLLIVRGIRWEKREIHVETTCVRVVKAGIVLSCS